MSDVTTAAAARPPQLPTAAQETLDWLEAGDIVLTWVRVVGATGLVAWHRGAEAGTPLPEADAVLALAGRAVWTTHRGGVVRWSDLPARIEPVGRVDTASTNDVLRVRADGVPAVLKVYRSMGAGQDEDATLTALASTGLVPKVVGRLTYEPAGAAPIVLALILQSVAGQTLDVPVRRGLEAAWRRGDDQLSTGDRQVLRRVRQATGALHAALAAAGRPSSAVRLADVLGDIEAIRCFARGAAAHRLLDRAAAAASWAPPAADVGPGHGDLHLSNVIVDGEDVRFVDLAGGGGPADDFAALRLGLECLCLDVEVDRAGRDRSRDDLAAALRRAAWDTTQERALFAPLRREEAAATGHDGPPAASGDDGRAWDRWCTRAGQELTGPGDPNGLASIARLIHDLRYHLKHERTYYADLAWWRLARWSTRREVAHA
jgi:predicted trehalose synthase